MIHEIPRPWRLGPFRLGRPEEWGRLVDPENKGKTLPQIVKGSRRRLNEEWVGEGDFEMQNVIIGEVVSWTRRRDGVVVALVEVTDDQGNKRRLTAQLTDLEGDPKIGMLVEMVTRRLGEEGDERGLIIYGYKFRPVIDHEEE